MTRVFVLVAMGLTLLAATAAEAQVMDRRAPGLQPRDGAAGAASAPSAPRPAPVEASFTEAEKKVIADYFAKEGRSGLDAESRNRGRDGRRRPGSENASNLPPGLANRDGLPPGLDKRDTLPPGLARRNLPAELQSRLPAAVPGTERVIIGDDVVLVRRATNIILDILKGAAAAGGNQG